MIARSVKSELINNLKIPPQTKVIQCHVHSTSLTMESDPIIYKCVHSQTTNNPSNTW